MSAPSVGKSFNIPIFKPPRIVPGQVIVMVGKRHSGKGFALKYLLHALKDNFASVVLFSGSEEEDAAWTNIIPDAFVYDQFDGEALARIVSAQRKLVKEKGKGPHTNLLVVFDDVMQDSSIFSKDRAMKEIFFSGRHTGITVFLLLQYVQSIPPGLRVNIDYIMLFSEPMYSNLVLLHKNYGGICGTFKQFQALHSTLTENYSCMVIQLSRLKSSSVDKAVSFFKATAPPPFRLGSADQWSFNRKYSMKQNRTKAKGFKQITI